MLCEAPTHVCVQHGYTAVRTSLARDLPLALSVHTVSNTDEARITRKRIPRKEPAGGTASLEAAVRGEPNRLKRYLTILGPGLVTGASDDDPSGIGTYAVAGASFGYSTLWTALVTLPLMASVQFICAKIGMVSGMGLAGVLRRHYPRALLYPAVLALFAAASALVLTWGQ